MLVKRFKEGNAVDRVESEVHLNGHLLSIDYVWELAIRIDDNMEESLTNVESACSALLRHLNQISSYRLDLATSGKGGIGTYIGICMISGAFGVADAHVQGGMVGDLSFMLPEFMQIDYKSSI
ncbi:unnamed protein product [Camellia sinensis]